MSNSNEIDSTVIDQVTEAAEIVDEVISAETSAAGSVTDREARLKAISEKAAQLMREGKYTEARRVLKESEVIRRDDQKQQWLAEARAEREKALELTDAGDLNEAQAALERAEVLEKKALGGLKRTKELIGSVRSIVPGRLKKESRAAEATAEEAAPVEEVPADPVGESIRIVGQHSKIAAAVGLLPGGPINYLGIFAVQVPMVWRISNAFGQKVSREQARGVLLSLFTSVLPGLIGQGAGLAVGSLTAAVTGTIFAIVATPVLAYALTRAVGNVFIMHFESGGTLLTFDPKAFTEHFVNEFRKAGGTVHEVEQSAPEASARPA